MSAWWDKFINKVVGPEEWRENFKMMRKNLKLKLPNFESRQSPKNATEWTQNILSIFMCGCKFVPFSL